jgi:hypothetical protein
MNDGMVDVSGFVADPVLGYGVRGRHMIYNYKSKYFGVCDMIVELVEPEPMQESLIYLARLREINEKRSREALWAKVFDKAQGSVG